MRKLIVVALLIFVCAAPVHAAPRGKAFYHGAQTPERLSVVTEGNLHEHPDGLHQLDSAKCAADGSCASPMDYLVTLQKRDPDAGLKQVSDLPGYFRSLVERDAHDGEYWMACLRPDRDSPTGYSPLMHCVRRAFKPGEKAWVNPKTGKIVLAQGCTNPVERPEKPEPCVYIHLKGVRITGIRLKQYGPTDESRDSCTALWRVGEIDPESPFVERCPDWRCNFRAADAAAGQKGQETGSFPTDPARSDIAIIRLPQKFAEKDSQYKIAFCADRGGEHSCGLIVEWYDYVPVKGKGTATIYADEETARKADAKTVTGARTDLWWRFEGGCY